MLDFHVSEGMSKFWGSYASKNTEHLEPQRAVMIIGQSGSLLTNQIQAVNATSTVSKLLYKLLQPVPNNIKP